MDKFYCIECGEVEVDEEDDLCEACWCLENDEDDDSEEEE